MSDASRQLANEFASADWYRALPLTARLPPPRGHDAASRIPERAHKRLARWKSQPPFASTSLFPARLAADEIAESDLLALLAETPESIRRRTTTMPNWLVKIERAFSQPPGEPISWPEEFRTPLAAGFLQGVQPLVDAAIRELHEGIRGLAENKTAVPFDPATAGALFLAHLPQRLLGRLSRTLVLELNVARVQGDLEGETAEARFASFIARLRSPANMLALLREYPVLARELIHGLDQWCETSMEFLERLAADWPAIRNRFADDTDPGRLTEVTADAGDRHRGGRSVFLLRFESGFRLAYKPKSLLVDVHFQELLDWIRERADVGDDAGSGRTPPSLRIPRVLNCGRYGWVEFIEARVCQSPEEVALFYRRQGAFLALLFSLGAIDFHHENLIAQGEHPVPIDLEALFHPLGLDQDRRGADTLANIVLYNSVFGVALLPGRIWSNPESEGVDISGLGAMPGQVMPFTGPAWEGEGTDEVRLIRKRYPLSEAQNRPTLQGAAVATLDYADDLIDGFRAMYCFLNHHREELLALDGPLTRFNQDEVRVVVRATRSYAELLRESFHPDVLRDALDRDRLFDRLWNGAEESANMAKLIPAERDDLWNGDVPVFTTLPESRDLWTSTGKRVTGVLEEAGIVRARRRIEAMGDDDLTRQMWFIRASLATLAPTGTGRHRTFHPLPESPPPAGRAEYLAAAKAIGNRLEQLAVHGDEDVSWIGLAFVRERTWSLVPLGTDFYDGLPGVALFLAYLGAVSGDGRYTRLARGAVKTLRNAIRQRPQGVPSVGAFGGWGGLIYTWTHLGKLWNDSELLAEAESFALRLPELIDKDENLDIIDGSAGCLLTLLGLERSLSRAESASALPIQSVENQRGESSGQILAAAVHCGERLIAKAQAMTSGVGWVTNVPAKGPLAGMSHGAAGIAWALVSLAVRTGEPRFMETAWKGLAYERSLFSREKKKWPDLRDFEDYVSDDSRFNYMIAWCHGSAGIGLARLAILQQLLESESPTGDDHSWFDGAVVGQEIDAAIQTTLAEGFGASHTLCHGDLGNLELLVQASQLLGEPHWQAEAERKGAGILESIRRHGWRCANPVGVESPGLMTGLAGVGYGLLRLAEPERVPSILTLVPPVCSLSVGANSIRR
jgi:type 2 lantibiotic biosynthesis protein LanM